MDRNLIKWISPLVALAIFLIALWALHRTLGQYDLDDILLQLKALPPAAIAGALTLSVASYLLLSLYDHLALRYLGRKLPAARVTLVSFSSYAFSHNVGFSLLTGGSIRYRMYSSWGLSAEEVARLTAFAALSFILGMTTVGSLVLLVSPADLPHLPYLPLERLWPLAAAGLAAVAGYLLLVKLRRRPVRLRGWEVPLPPLRFAVGQVLAGAAEWTVTASVIYPLLPPGAGLSPPEFLQIYLLAQLVAMFSHVPGGLGVFETVFLLLVPTVPPPALFGSLLVYRALYYLLPFFISILLLSLFEAIRQRQRARRAGAVLGQWMAAAGPLLLAAGVFAAGGVLLFSAVIPGPAAGPESPGSILPPVLLGLGSVLAAVTGTGLLLVARGLQMRLRSAWKSAVVLVAAGGLLGFAGGDGIAAALVCLLVLAALLPSREQFPRLRRLRDEPFTPWWTALILIVHAAAVWVSLFSLHRFGFAPSLQRGAFTAEAARILLAEAGSGLLLVFFALLKRRLRPAAGAEPDQAALSRAAVLAARASAATPHLVWRGDKRLLFSPAGDAFLMYVERERSLVAVGEPVGAAGQRAELLWRFHEICDRVGRWPVLFAVGADLSRVCLDLGMALQPVGREATIPLFEFSPHELAPAVRDHYRRGIEAGCTFTVVGNGDSARLLPEVAALLARRSPAEENRCGLLQSPFAPALVGRFPLVVVRQQGEVVAAASLPPTNNGADLVLGHTRFAATADTGIAEFLVVSICLWGREAGLSRLNLGLVPDLDPGGHSLDAAWQRFGPRIFSHAELFPDLETLRRFKESFRPRWQSPLFLACPEALFLPDILADVAGGEGRSAPGGERA